MVRELRGFSQEHMADRLGIAQNTYSKIETNQTKLTAEMLEKVSKELGVSALDILSHEPTIVNMASNHGTQGIAYIENFYTYQKELIETIKTTLDTVIEHNKILMKFINDKNQANNS